MIKRKQYSEEYKRKLGLELSAGISTAAEMSKREGISSTTLYKWRDMVQNITVDPDEKEVLEMRKLIKDQGETISEQALQIHILKKTQKIMEQLKKQERSSGSISPLTSESNGAVKR
jgi:transposase-like protein